ncbi:MAG: hypothetical protein WAR21_02280 [Candidatus Acidiferrales bacterium]
MYWRTALRTTALGAAVLLGGIMLSGTTAQAANCGDRISKQEGKLRRDIERHGYNSRQAENDRRQLQSIRASCGYGGRGWGGWGSRRGDGDNDRDDRWRNRGGDRDRDDRGRNWHRRDRDRDRDRDRNWRRDRDDR